MFQVIRSKRHVNKWLEFKNNTMKNQFIFIIFILFVTSCSVHRAGSKESCNYLEKWADYSQLKVTYQNVDSTSLESFDFYRNQKEKLVIARFGKNEETYKMLLIPGVATAYQGFKDNGNKTYVDCSPIVGDSSSILNSYSVNALYFLGRAHKNGPLTIHDKKTIEINEKGPSQRIQINPGDHMILETPWNLAGTLKKLANGDIEFKFKRSFIKNKKNTIESITGTWSIRDIEIPIQDQHDLKDWLVCVSGKYNGGYKKSNFVPIVEELSKLETFKDLRAIQK